MVSNVGLELSRFIDPYLNWKTASKGRQRAVRRRRTSFTRGDINKSLSKSLKERADLIGKDAKRAGDMPVSESEKLGVSILGRRFSDTSKFVPIKKRKVCLVRSPSPPPQLSSISDFSGIALLAAAACDISMADCIMNAGGSMSKGHSSGGGVSGDLDIKTLDNVQNTVTSVESSSRNHRFHWDLNIALDLWDCDDNVVNTESPVASVMGEDDIRDEKLVNTEPCQGQVRLSGANHAADLVDTSVHLLCPGLDQKTTIVALEENKISVTDLDLNSNVKTQGEIDASLHIDSEKSVVDQSSTSSHLAEEAVDVLVERNSARRILAHTDGISNEVEHSDTLNVNTHDDVNNSKLDSSSCMCDSHNSTCQGSSHNDESSSGSTSAGKHLTTADIKMKDNGCSVLAGEIFNATETDDPPIDASLSFHETCKSYVGSYGNSHSEVAAEDHSDHDFNFYTSKNETDQAIGLERVELPTDDEFEDGEFRGSIAISWGSDEAEDLESEHVDCGLDERGLDVADATSVHFDNIECNNVGLSEVSKVHCDGSHAGNDAQDVVVQPFLHHPLIRCISEAGRGKGISEKLTTKNSSGWDHWPEGHKKSGDVVMDSGVEPANKSQTAATLNASSVCEFMKSAVGSKSRKDLPARVESPKSSGWSHIKDKYYARTCRYDGGAADRSRSFRGGRSSLRMYDRDRVVHWVDSRNHWNQNFRDSPRYYGPANFTHPGSSNAATAVAAKLESNGFVITSDGTIVKAGGAGPNDRVLRRSVDASLRRTCHRVQKRRSSIERDGDFGMPRGLEKRRETSPDRHEDRTHRYDLGVVRTCHKERYLASVPYDRPLSLNEPSFLPRRQPLPLSPSRSRTHSPMWTPPRGSSDHGFNRSPGLRRRSRSPYLRTKGMPERMGPRLQDRMRSPSFKHMVGYTPSDINHASRPRVSR